MQKLLVELTQRPEMQIESRETKGYSAVLFFFKCCQSRRPTLRKEQQPWLISSVQADILLLKRNGLRVHTLDRLII